MATVTRRTFRSSPHRDAVATWATISDLLTRTNTGAQQELGIVAGIASSVIADKACENSPIIVSCEGPQTRIYCIYDDDAIDGSDANEDVLGFDPLNGDWSISLPCEPDDLGWVQSALQQKSKLPMGLPEPLIEDTLTKPLPMNLNGLLEKTWIWV